MREKSALIHTFAKIVLVKFDLFIKFADFKTPARYNFCNSTSHDSFFINYSKPDVLPQQFAI